MSKTKTLGNAQNGKFGKFIKNNKYILISALVAFLITQLIYFCYSLAPYGDMTILRMDLYHQYGPLFAELYDRLTDGGSLIYSWNSGLGSSFLGNFFNYLASPTSLIILVFGHKNIPEAIAAMIAIKATLSAGVFTYYLKKSLGKHDILSAAFGILYAFCGFFIAYYWNLMWLDAMVIFPLILLGIEKIIKQGKPSLYCIALALTFISNYYMAYMVCIFSVLYFFTYYFANYPLGKKFNDKLDKNATIFKKLSNSVFFSSGIKFAFFSLVAVLLAAFALLPLMSILTSSSATSGGAPTEFKKYFTVFDFLANHLTAVEPTIRSSGTDVLPNVYCGVLTLILVPLFLFNKKIQIREKVSYVCLLGVIYFSFSVNYLNFFWHGFHFPNDLPYRFSFMYSFILLVIAYKAISHIKEYSGKEILCAGIGFAGFLILVEKLSSKNVGDLSLGLSLIFGAGYVLILRLLQNKKFQTSAVAVLLFCTITSEIALGNTNNYSMNQSKANYTNDYDDFTVLKDKLDEYDGGFYRMELTKLRTRMDPSWYNYNGVSIFSSMAYEKVANMQQDLGMFGNYINSYTYNPQTAVYNAMFGLKYLVDNDDYGLNENIYSRLMSTGKFTAYKNEYSLPIAFAAEAEVADWAASEPKNPFLSQAKWFELATGVSDVFDKLSVSDITYDNISSFTDSEIQSGSIKYSKLFKDTNASLTIEIVPEKTQNVYIYLKSTSVDSATINASGYSKPFNTEDGYIVDIGERQAGDTVYLDIPLKSSAAETGNITFYAYGLNDENFAKGYDELNDNGALNITSYSDTEIVGSLTADSNQIVYTSIPYDANWNVYIDGVRVPSSQVLKISDSLIGFNISTGEHEITLQYVSSGLMAGSIISITTIIIATLFIIMKRRKILFYKKVKESKWNLIDADKAPADESFEVEFENSDLKEPATKEIQSDAAIEDSHNDTQGEPNSKDDK